jgi:hypothetical protein
MDLNKIFSMFDDVDSKDTDEVNLLVDFSDHPLYWIGGFNKIINNYVFFTQYITKNFNNIPPELNQEEIDIVGITLLFNRSWEYIRRLNLDNPFHIDCLKIKSSESLNNSLEAAIFFFEKIEEYEKCAFLKSIQDKVKDFLI